MPRKDVPVLGKVIARSTRGERVEEASDGLWLVKLGGEREQVTDEWLEQAFKSGGWRDEYEGVREPAFPSQGRKEEVVETPRLEAVRQTEEGKKEGLPFVWETEIASDLSFHDRITPDMLLHVPLDKRAFALQEYARLHPDEAYWDGEALVRKGKEKAE